MLPRLEVDTVSLTDAAPSIRGVGSSVGDVRGNLGSARAGSSGAGSPAAGAALEAVVQAWQNCLGDLAENLQGFARNTEAAAVLYEHADQISVPQPKPPPPAPAPACKQTLFGADCSNLVA
jgi:hypothetical protein